MELCVYVCVYVSFLRHCRPVVPMEFAGNTYFNIKNTIIKYERFLLKVGVRRPVNWCLVEHEHVLCMSVHFLSIQELGFCVHVQHPHKVSGAVVISQLLSKLRNAHSSTLGSDVAWVRFISADHVTPSMHQSELTIAACMCVCIRCVLLTF